MPSVTFWIVLGCWISVSATLYIRVLYVIKTAKNAMYDTFFFRQFFSQGLFDMTFFAVYIVFNTLSPTANLSLNGTILLRIQYLHTYYFLYAQVLGICLMSLNRLFIMNLTSRFSTFCEELPQILVFFIQLVVPFFLIVHILFQPEPYYTLQNGNVVRVIAPESVFVNATQAALTTSFACAVCAVSYALLLRKLFAYSKSIKTQSSGSGRYFHMERALSLMGFTLFIALCVVTAFYVTILAGILLNPTTYRFITSYYPHIIAVISFMNPWALIITNANTRKRLFPIRAQNAMAIATIGPVVMFLVNFLSRNDTDQFVPLFEVIYIIELIFIFLAQLASGVVFLLVLKTASMQRLNKLRIIFTVLLACFYVSTRLILMHHQYFVEITSLIFASMTMQTFISYMASLVLFLALDRLVATRAWSWYESDATSTLLFFALQEILLYSIAITCAYLIVHGYISSMQSVYFFAVMIIAGSSVFTLVFRHNLRVLRELKRGAVINNYSISRTYQIRENVDLLTIYTRIARPLVFVSLPPFAFYPIFHLVPANIGHDGLRFFAAAMYHLASAVVIGCLPLYFPRLLQTLKSRTQRAKTAPSTTIIENTQELGDTYFNQLVDNWK